MKNIKVFNIIFFLLLIPCMTVHAADIEKRKNYSKSYPLQRNQAVKIENQFGKIEINAWNRNEVKVDVTIITSSNEERIAQSLLDHINIESSDGNPVSFATKFSVSSNSGKNTSSKIEVNYTVYMPAANPLHIKNKFGNTFVPDWNGDISLEQSFGDIIAGELRNAKDIKVKFGSFAATSIKDGNVKISYSNIKVDKLTGDISSKIDFCEGVRLGVLQTLQKLDMKVSYSDILLNLSPALEATFQIKTNFGSLKNSSSVDIINQTKEKKYGATFNKTYTGHKGSGTAIINIDSNFGNISLK